MLGNKFLDQVPNPEDQVRLKPVLGMRPGVYIAVICSLVLALVCFLILIYPGITRPGSVVVFTSEPAGAALRVDDVYMGSSPCRVFVSRGKHIMETVLPGFEPVRGEYVIPGRLFASALFPRQYSLHETLHTADPAAALAISALDYAAWSFGGEPTAAWQTPMSLSEGVYRIGQAAAGLGTQEILAASARFAVTRAAVRDLVRAKILALNGGIAPSPLTIAHSAGAIRTFLADNTGSAAWLADTLAPDAVDILIASKWYQNQFTAFSRTTAGEMLSPSPNENWNSTSVPPESQIRVGGLLFTGMSGGTLAQGEPFPHEAPIEAFMICATEVPSPAYADFLEANPQWRREQITVLEQQGLVNSDYLADYGNAVWQDSRAGMGISMVSWFAAQAFCEWLSGKLPDSLAGWEVRLPTEAEWEYAAKSSQSWDNYYRIFASDGSSWEWCLEPYSPLPFISAPPQAITLVNSPERPVRGGSWLHTEGAPGVETRASLPPAFCSPFVSFRPVIARRNENRNGMGR